MILHHRHRSSSSVLFLLLSSRVGTRKTTQVTQKKQKKPMDNTTATPTQSARFQELQALLRSALQSSRQTFDIPAVVQEAYGEDEAIFGRSTSHSDESESESNNMLRQVFESMLDRIHDDVTEYMGEFLEEKQIEAKLLHVEQVIAQLQQKEDQERQVDDLDKQMTEQAVKLAKERSGMEDVSDILAAKTHIQLSKQRDILQNELHNVQEELQQLEEQKQEKLTDQGILVNELQQVTKEMEKSADIGSMMHKY